MDFFLKKSYTFSHFDSSGIYRMGLQKSTIQQTLRLSRKNSHTFGEKSLTVLESWDIILQNDLLSRPNILSKMSAVRVCVCVSHRPGRPTQNI